MTLILLIVLVYIGLTVFFPHDGAVYFAVKLLLSVIGGFISWVIFSLLKGLFW